MPSSLVPVVVQSLSRVWFYVAPWTTAHQASLFFTISQCLLNSGSWSRWCHPTISSCHSLLLPTSTFPNIRVFSNESTVQIWWPKYWSFSASISVSNECWELILFRIDWLDLLSVQGTVMSLSEHHSWKAPVFRCSIFFLVQLSYPYMTTGKVFALTRWTFVSEVTSVLFNTLSLSYLFFQGVGVL